MRALGDKISSTIVAQSAAVPTIQWSGDGWAHTFLFFFLFFLLLLGFLFHSLFEHSKFVITIGIAGLRVECNTKKGEVVNVPEDIYLKACVTDVQSALESAERIGFPVMIKASEGGGGKGIRKALDAKSFPALFQQVLGTHAFDLSHPILFFFLTSWICFFLIFG